MQGQNKQYTYSLRRLISAPRGAAWRAVHHSQPPCSVHGPPVLCRQPCGVAMAAPCPLVLRLQCRSSSTRCCQNSTAPPLHLHRRFSLSLPAVPRPLGFLLAGWLHPQGCVAGWRRWFCSLGCSAFAPCRVWRCSLCTKRPPAPAWRQQSVQGGAEQRLHVLELLLAVMGSSVSAAPELPPEGRVWKSSHITVPRGFAKAPASHRAAAAGF